MPRPPRNLKQMELYGPQLRIPDWKTLPENVRERAVRELARMFRERMDRISPAEEKGGSANE